MKTLEFGFFVEGLESGASGGGPPARPPDFPPSRAGTTGTWAEKEAYMHYLDALLAA
jgi:hypothetical protein